MYKFFGGNKSKMPSASKSQPQKAKQIESLNKVKLVLLIQKMLNSCFCLLLFYSIFVMWISCRFLETAIDCSNSGCVRCCVFVQDTLSALLQSTQL